jgi:hypothetical protein
MTLNYKIPHSLCVGFESFNLMRTPYERPLSPLTITMTNLKLRNYPFSYRYHGVTTYIHSLHHKGSIWDPTMEMGTIRKIHDQVHIQLLH